MPDRPKAKAEWMFQMFNAYPSLLPNAPEEVTMTDVRNRRLTKTYCIHCGAPAEVAYLALHKSAGRKWIDLCRECHDWVKEAFARIQDRRDAGISNPWEEEQT